MTEWELSDETLVRSLPGNFRNGFAEVNGIRLHYVIGGAGRPLFLLPGWPQTWWAFHKVMPALSRHYRVVAVDIRGMGGSAKPSGGYDKKTMACDVRELAQHLGYEKVDIVGHDIGAHVAYSCAANQAHAVGKVALLDVTHPYEGLGQLPLLPRLGQRVNPNEPGSGPVYLWWWAFNQVRGLPEQLLCGRSRYLVDWLMDLWAVSLDVIDDRDRAVYASAYSTPDAIRAGNSWYQAFLQDIEDERGYERLAVPVLALGGNANFEMLRRVLPTKVRDVKVVLVGNSGHYIAEEQPEVVVAHLTEFFA